MKLINSMKYLLALSCALLSMSVVANHHGEKKSHDIVQVLQNDEQFSTLVKAIEAAGITDILKDSGDITVFAPNNTAFEKLPEGKLDELLKPENKEKLVKVLTYHVAEGKIDAEQAAANKYAESLEGTNLQLMVKGSRMTVEKTMIVEENIRANNGIVHVIEKVLMPKS
ncbi:fasciclin domain-containing protein [Salinimonas marina]|uniref:Fasciclin domain-containing protein n=1 Tax=Salinimonas marina TaxID=2785918 RepID=A0A7S9DZ74_9ALTE|nr:fasciclin domain-containing protein [Salinimonas marina]QPG06055.1 fasciclin domain-containing protein [Salinimonas marina]